MQSPALNSIWLAGLVGITFVANAAKADPIGPPPEVAERYQGHRVLIGYPPTTPVRGSHHNDADWLPYFRLTAVSHGHIIDAAEAAKIAQDVAAKGFNVVISEDARYLLRDAGDKVAPGETDTAGLPFPELVANTRRLVDAFHHQGIRFIGHLTCAQVTFDYAERHPDQRMIDINTGRADGEKNYGVAYMCYENPDYWKKYLQRVSDYIDGSHIDGIMVDEIQTFYTTPNGCGCPFCRAGFKAATGIDLPPIGKPGNWFRPANLDYQKWLTWRNQQVVERQNEIRDVLRAKRGLDATDWTYKANPSYPASFTACSLSANGMAGFADSIGIEVEPPGEPRIYTYYWRNNAADAKIVQALAAHRKGVSWGLYYSSLPHDYTWNFLLNLSLGTKQWWSSNSISDTPSWQPLLTWETRHEQLLAHFQQAGNIGIVYSELTQNHHPLSAGSDEHPFGFVNMCDTLFDSAIPFRALLDRDLDEDNLKGIDTLVLPCASLMSQSAIAHVRDFVRNGGTLVATGDTSLYDEQSNARKDFGLADLFGVRFISYQRDEKSRVEGTPNPSPAADAPAATMPYGRDYCTVEVTDPAASTWGTLVDGKGLRHPGIIATHYGKGKVIYFSFRPEQKYASQHLSYGAQLVEPGQQWTDQRDPTSIKWIVNAVLAGARPQVEVENVRRGIFVNASTQKYGDVDNTIVTLTNYLGAELTTGVVPLNLDPVFPDSGPLLPHRNQPIVVRALVSKTNTVYLVSPDYPHAIRMPFHQEGNRVVVDLPRLDRFAMLLFTHGKRDLVRELDGSALATQQPQPVPLVIEDVPPLIGAYDPDAVVAFVGLDKSFEGGRDYGRYKGQPTRIAYGARSPYPRVKATLRLTAIPAHAMLTLGGMDDNQPSKAPIDLLVNGTSVFRGDSTFPDNEWATHSFAIPDGVLKVGDNEVELRNIGDSASPSSPPWFGVTFFKIAPSRGGG